MKYYDADNVLQTVLVADYIIDNSAMPTRLALAPSQSWPTIADRINAIEINYRVGVDSADDVDGAIKQAVLLTIGHWYQNRETVVIGRIATEVPISAKYLLDQYKIQVCR